VPLFTARISDTVAPNRLGRSFRWLLASSFISNVGDGIALAAGPLLVASLTHDPFIVSMALLAQQLPNLLFGLPAGAIADRYDRRRIIAAVNLARAAVLAVLAATLVGGAVSIAVVLLTLFILGTAEIFADVSSNSLVPRVVPREDLGIANARLTGSFLLTNELLGPPIGAFLFTVGLGLPFAANAACFALGAVLVTRVATDAADLTAERRAERHVDHVHVIRDRPIERFDDQVRRAFAAEYANRINVRARRDAGADFERIRAVRRRVSGPAARAARRARLVHVLLDERSRACVLQPDPA